jgi:hypothetical protein
MCVVTIEQRRDTTFSATYFDERKRDAAQTRDLGRFIPRMDNLPVGTIAAGVAVVAGAAAVAYTVSSRALRVRALIS